MISRRVVMLSDLTVNRTKANMGLEEYGYVVVSRYTPNGRDGLCNV